MLSHLPPQDLRRIPLRPVEGLVQFPRHSKNIAVDDTVIFRTPGLHLEIRTLQFGHLPNNGDCFTILARPTGLVNQVVGHGQPVWTGHLSETFQETGVLEGFVGRCEIHVDVPVFRLDHSGLTVVAGLNAGILSAPFLPAR